MPATSCPGGHDRPTQDSHPVKTLGPDSTASRSVRYAGHELSGWS
jgi:hypothetical protein